MSTNQREWRRYLFPDERVEMKRLDAEIKRGAKDLTALRSMREKIQNRATVRAKVGADKKARKTKRKSRAITASASGSPLTMTKTTSTMSYRMKRLPNRNAGDGTMDAYRPFARRPAAKNATGFARCRAPNKRNENERDSRSC